MVNDGRIIEDDVKHLKDTYVWVWHAVYPDLHVIQRATYYTYCTGDQDKADEISHFGITRQVQLSIS